jgi:protein transport protein SEC24
LLTLVPPAYYAHLAATGQRVDHHDRPELLHGTVDFAVPREYWAPQPSASLLDASEEGTNLAAAGDALASTASDLLGGLQTSLGQTPTNTRGPSPAPGYREKEKERKKEERRLRRSRPMGRVFVIDVSGPSVHRGIVKEVCEGIRRSLYGSKRKEDESEEQDEDVIGPEERIAIVTVAETVGFWNLSVSDRLEFELTEDGCTFDDGGFGLGGHVLSPHTWISRESRRGEDEYRRTARHAAGNDGK